MAVLRLRLRTRSDAGPAESVAAVPGADLALLLCDVWDRHWCSGATARLEAMVPEMDATVRAARAAGALIIHAPSDVIGHYASSPARARALAAPAAQAPASRQIEAPPLPIDDSDGGCDSGERPWHRAWSRQHAGIGIDEAVDVISADGAEIYRVLRAGGIRMLAVLGVHTNMCVLGRSFGIRQMTRWGMPCLLVRDLTDAMYNPAMPPYVSHERGTELVIGHIERYWCPSVAAADLREPAP